MDIDKKILSDIREFCKLNGIKDVRGVVNECLTSGFNIMKYGVSPFEQKKSAEPVLKASDSVSVVSETTMKVNDEKPQEDKINDISVASVKKPRRIKIVKNNG